MARNPSGLPSNKRGPWSKPSDERSPGGFREADRYRNTPWPRVLSQAEIREFGLSQDDVEAIDTLAESVFRSELSDDEAVSAFDSAFGWAVSDETDERGAA